MTSQRFTPDTRLAEWFGFHPASDAAKRQAHEDVRVTFYAAAVEMNALLPEGPDKTVALRAIRDAAMLCNATLAVNGGPDNGFDLNEFHGSHARKILEEPDVHLTSTLNFG